LKARWSPRAWVAGLVVGVASGFWFAEWPTFGAFLAVAFAVPALLSRARLAALGGLFVGLPATWLAVIGLATKRCTDFDAQRGQECVMTDVGSWVAFATGLLLLGAISTLIASRR
jgi:uncharacterized protein (DUF2062 family)